MLDVDSGQPTFLSRIENLKLDLAKVVPKSLTSGEIPNGELFLQVSNLMTQVSELWSSATANPYFRKYLYAVQQEKAVEYAKRNGAALDEQTFSEERSRLESLGRQVYGWSSDDEYLSRNPKHPNIWVNKVEHVKDVLEVIAEAYTRNSRQGV